MTQFEIDLMAYKHKGLCNKRSPSICNVCKYNDMYGEYDCVPDTHTDNEKYYKFKYNRAKKSILQELFK